MRSSLWLLVLIDVFSGEVRTRKFMKGCILIAITLCLFGCGNEGPEPVSPRGPDSTIHLAGNVGGGNYWKNGIRSVVGENGLWVQSMAVDDTSVVIGGTVGGTESGKVIVQDGKETRLASGGSGLVLVAARDKKIFGVWIDTDQVPGWELYKNGTTTAIDPTGSPTAIALHGDDVYISGSRHGFEYPWMVSPWYHLDTYALCWKNEHEVFRETVHSSANTIFVHGDDIYLGGHLNHYPSLNKVACYWKNGERIALTREDQDAEVKALFVTNTHVYAAGVVNDRAVYWQDGFVIEVGAEPSVANSISVLGTNVFVAGREGKYPAVWKNAIKQDIHTQDSQGEIKVVVAVSNLPATPE